MALSLIGLKSQRQAAVGAAHILRLSDSSHRCGKHENNDEEKNAALCPARLATHGISPRGTGEPQCAGLPLQILRESAGLCSYPALDPPVVRPPADHRLFD